jgi:hypothetical protein
MNSSKTQTVKKTHVLRFRVTPAQFRQFMKESKKHKGERSALLRFLMEKYFQKDGF